MAEFFNQLRHPDQLLGKVGAALKNIERMCRDGRVQVEERKQVGIGRHLFDEVLESARAAPQCRARKGMAERGCALIEEGSKIGGGRLLRLLATDFGWGG